MIFYIQKGENRLLSTYLNSSEFHCHCKHPDCTFTLVGESTAAKFHLVRTQFAEAVQINSAFRCQRHNADVGGKINSYHVKGMAMDLTPKDFSKEKLDRLQYIARMYYEVVVPYPTFIHCHNVR